MKMERFRRQLGPIAWGITLYLWIAALFILSSCSKQSEEPAQPTVELRRASRPPLGTPIREPKPTPKPSIQPVSSPVPSPAPVETVPPEATPPTDPCNG